VISFELPWPPSINHYYTRTSTGVMINKRAREYRRETLYLLSKYKGSFTEIERLQMIINLYPPDRRKRDIDNHCKSLIDCLQNAKVFPDDEQIDRLTVSRREQTKGGCAMVYIEAC